MKKLLLSTFVLFSTLANAQDNFSPAFTKINADVQSNSQAYQNLKKQIETIGHRLTGSENGSKVEQFTYDIFKSYGFDVKFQPFEVESWSRKTINVEIGADKNALSKVKAVTLAHSPVSANVTGQIVDAGNGLEKDYLANPGKFKGKIALIYLGVLPGSAEGTKTLHRSEKTALATKYGAIGVIIINTVKGGTLLTGTASVTGKLIPIPAVCIGLEDGMALKESLKSKEQFAKLEMTNFSGLIKARNVVATLKGTELPKEKIVVGGHLDSWDLADGALDNGIGSFAIIDMARTLKKLGANNKRTIEFVMFMGEEQGLLGSRAYVREAKQNNTLNQVKFMLNFDMTNNPKGFGSSRAEMKDLFTQWGSEVSKIDAGFTNAYRTGAGLHSDNQPFMMQGIPTGGGTGGQLPNNGGQFYHSDGDSFQLVDEQELKNTVRYGAMLAYALANTPTIPVKVQTDAELKAYLEAQNLKTALEIAGEWRWK